MTSAFRRLLQTVSLLSVIGTSLCFGQTNCTPLTGGCNPPEQPSQCFPGVDGPAIWTDPGGIHTVQWRRALISPETTSHGQLTNDQPPYCGGQYEVSCSGANPTVRVYTRGTRILIDYDAPNYYCQQPGDWPPGFTCTNDPLAISDNLILEDSGGNIWSVGFIFFEYGTWDTGIDIPCGSTSTWSTRIEYVCAGGGPYPFKIATNSAPLTGDCKDRNPCPTCDQGGPNTSPGTPVHLGSGDVSYAEPLSSVGQSPLPLSFGLTYHSSEPLFPALVSSPVGAGWTHTFSQPLVPTDATGATLYRMTGEGLEEEYQSAGVGVWNAASPAVLRGTVTLDSATNRYLLTDLDGTVTAFDSATGRWLSTTDRWANAIAGTYDGNGNLSNVTDSMGRQIVLSYANGQLTQIALPDGQTWKLAYAGSTLAAIFDPLHTGITPWRAYTYQPDSHGVARLLTGVQDESGIELEGHSYDAQDRGVTSVSEGGRSQVTVEYDTPTAGQNRVTHAIDGSTSQQSVFTMHYTGGQFLPDRIDGDCATCGGGSDSYTFQFDSSNHVSLMADANGHTTIFTYDANGNVTSRTEAQGTSLARTTTYRYDYAPWPSFRTQVTEPSAAKSNAQKVTTLSWNSSGASETTLTRQESGYLSSSDGSPTTYTSTSTFDARHRLLTTVGPRTDVNQTTTRVYYPDNDSTANRRGRLKQVTDPVGLATTYDNYDIFGTARTVTDANGVVTQIQTDAKGRVATSTLKAVSGDPSESSDYVTGYTFDGRDRLSKTTLPRSNGLSYAYEDGTNRLTDTVRLDSTGKQYERRHLTLNAIGDKIAEEDQSCGAAAAPCAAWTTARQEGYVYDSHNRLVQINHPVPAGANVQNAYDGDGLLTSVKDENHSTPNTVYAYDALHRLTSVTQTLAGTPSGQAITRYTYDVMDNLATVTDPNGNTTRYFYDDFRRLAQQDSPVTGTTVYQYDPAGNLVSTTDARGAATTKTFDADNRILTSSSALSASTEGVQYTYDAFGSGNYGKGRLAQMTDPSGSTSYTYERRGLLKGENRSILGNGYTSGYHYDANGNRDQVTYPSGHSVSNTFDFADRPVSAQSSSTVFVSTASYLPFGPETSLTFGNGTVKTMTYDQRYRPTENKLASATGTIADYTYAEDALGNIIQIHDEKDITFNRDFAYDDLNRLTGASTGYSLWGAGSYTYDPMGNMKTLGLGSARTATFAYSGTLPKLAAVTEDGNTRAVSYDPAGNEIAVGTAAYVYSPRNFLASGDGLAYSYDGRGLRVATTVAAQFGTITGTVVNASTNAPIANAEVRITGSPSATATDASGNFTLTQAAGTYMLAVSAPGFLPFTSPSFTLSPGATFSAGTIALQVAPGTITGSVVSSDGGGTVQGATVTILPVNQTVSTDSSGNFSISEPPGTYSVTIGKAGYATQSTPPFALAAGAIYSLGTVTLAANPATVTGHVIDGTTSAALPGVLVTATAVPGGPIPTVVTRTEALAPMTGPGGPYTATTDASGNFTLSVPAGNYSISFAQTG